ncbi:hypothetical protein AAHC03_024437 [Spirometra sp. Aus1]
MWYKKSVSRPTGTLDNTRCGYGGQVSGHVRRKSRVARRKQKSTQLKHKIRRHHTVTALTSNLFSLPKAASVTRNWWQLQR